MKKISIVLVALVCFAIGMSAQSPSKKWGLSLYGGIHQYNGDIGNDFFRFDDFYYLGGLTAARAIDDNISIELDFNMGSIGSKDSQNVEFFNTLLQARVLGKYTFFDYDTYKFRPFVFLGVGYMAYDVISEKSTTNTFQIPVGIGVNYKINETIGLVFRETFVYSFDDEIDGIKDGGNEMYLQHTLGLTFNIGEPKDTDGDGVCDRKDECPEVAGLMEFMGCPDSDGDGIEDRKDECPNEAGLLVFNGCPDSDGDSIEDRLDECPNKAGLAEFNGCPDTDGDGIQDSKDACPNEPGPVEYNGCPDRDGDGINDNEDACPDVKGLAKFKGCPDTDGDGIEDSKDLCPKVPGVAANKGCPEVKREVRKILEKALHGINFRSGKSIIYRSSYPILDNVADVMKMNPAYKLKIQGHTDSYGNDAKNMQLSKDRAQAVKDYLVRKGVASNRLTPAGFGETKPIASNKTSAGRAKNRRVELIVQF